MFSDARPTGRTPQEPVGPRPLADVDLFARPTSTGPSHAYRAAVAHVATCRTCGGRH